jgi:hypothetical protein
MGYRLVVSHLLTRSEVMSRSIWLSGLVVAIGLAQLQGNEKEAKQDAPKSAAFEKLKKLVGEWYIADDKGQPTDKLVSVFKLTAAGSTIQETMFPGEACEMISMYHLDGDDLILTHYCAVGNQPKLKLDPKSSEKVLKFQFAGGTNLDPSKDLHMHEGSITFTDDDHITSAWCGFQGGKPAAQQCEAMKLVRKKK